MQTNCFNLIDRKLNTSPPIDSILTVNQGHEFRAITFVNPFSYYKLSSHEHIVNCFDYIYSDGTLLTFLHNLFFPINKISRTSFDFSSSAECVFQHAEKYRLSVSLIGGTNIENSNCLNYLKSRYPEIEIPFSRNGFFADSYDTEKCVQEALSSDCKIFIIGMGTPIQDMFLIKLKMAATNPGLAFTCGGFITQTGTKGDYYYPIVKKTGMRWLQRFVMHPHVRKRVLIDYPIFLIKYFTDHIFRKHN